MLREIEDLDKGALARNKEIAETLRKEYSTSFIFQLKTILDRTNLALCRNAHYQYTRLLSHSIIALVTGLTFLHLGHEARKLQYRVFVIFTVTVLPALIIAQIEPQFIMSLKTYYQEALFNLPTLLWGHHSAALLTYVRLTSVRSNCHFADHVDGFTGLLEVLALLRR